MNAVAAALHLDEGSADFVLVDVVAEQFANLRDADELLRAGGQLLDRVADALLDGGRMASSRW